MFDPCHTLGPPVRPVRRRVCRRKQLSWAFRWRPTSFRCRRSRGWLSERQPVPTSEHLVRLSVATVPSRSSPAAQLRPITRAMAATEIPAEPTLVVVFDTGKLDAALSLGMTPTAAVRPDLILWKKVRHEGLHDELPEIAPTLLGEAVGVVEGQPTAGGEGPGQGGRSRGGDWRLRGRRHGARPVAAGSRVYSRKSFIVPSSPTSALRRPRWRLASSPPTPRSARSSWRWPSSNLLSRHLLRQQVQVDAGSPTVQDLRRLGLVALDQAADRRPE